MKPLPAAFIVAVVALAAGFCVGRLSVRAQPASVAGDQSQFDNLQSQLKAIRARLDENAPSPGPAQGNPAPDARSHGQAGEKELLAQLQQTLESENRKLREEMGALQRLVAEAEQNRYSQFVRAGVHLHEAGYEDQAIVEFTKAIGCDPTQAGAYLDRGLAFQSLGHWKKARADFLKATEVAPENFMAWNNLAWLLATCPTAEIRDGKAAKTSAEKACELTEWKYFAPISSLAAAYAEARQFPQAIEWQEKAIAAAPVQVHAALQEHLELLRKEQPIRQEVAESNTDAQP